MKVRCMRGDERSEQEHRRPNEKFAPKQPSRCIATLPKGESSGGTFLSRHVSLRNYTCASTTMSHSGHTHAPGEDHNHSHGPPPPQLAQSAANFQAQAPLPDPSLQAIIEADFKPVKNLALGPPNNAVALCKGHGQEKCLECDVDYLNLNRISKLLTNNPTLLCPPPPNVISQKLTQIVTQTKDEGNVRTGFTPLDHQD